MFWNDIARGIGIFMILLGLSSPIIIVSLIYYLKKRLEHKQIMAAIEKGTPLSELMLVPPAKPTGPLWIKNLTAGIALLIVAVALVGIWLVHLSHEGYGYDGSFGYLLVGVILFAIGISRLIRGLLQRKTQQQIQSLDQTNAGENKKPPGSPAPRPSE